MNKTFCAGPAGLNGWNGLSAVAAMRNPFQPLPRAGPTQDVLLQEQGMLPRAFFYSFLVSQFEVWFYYFLYRAINHITEQPGASVKSA